MRIEHVALWVDDLELMKTFYTQYFDTVSGDKYENLKKGFSSYFLSFIDGARIELMKSHDIKEKGSNAIGWAHISISVGTQQKVNEVSERLLKDGYKIFDGPRTTGDGYYESKLEDPEGNIIEITV